ncbi:hypothetical protein DFH27DRAFT_97292 [Peziza echinospora]|nr:hypothetical protein DFH27DRAFT_97292 [Peziza echinospora]
MDRIQWRNKVFSGLIFLLQAPSIYLPPLPYWLDISVNLRTRVCVCEVCECVFILSLQKRSLHPPPLLVPFPPLFTSFFPPPFFLSSFFVSFRYISFYSYFSFPIFMSLFFFFSSWSLTT